MGSQKVYTPCATLEIGCVVYTTYSLIETLTSTYFSDGIYTYGVDENGYIISKESCSRGFLFEIQLTGSTTYSLPTSIYGEILCTVYWGDGTSDVINAYNDAHATHDYGLTGKYIIEITGRMDSFFGWPNTIEITRIIDWGNPLYFDGFATNNLFLGGFSVNSAQNMVSIPSSGKMLARGNGCLRLHGAFQNCNSLTGITAGLFDNHPYCGDFGTAFANCWNIPIIPDYLFRPHTTNGVDFSGTFAHCNKLKISPNIWCDDATERTTRFASTPSRMNFTSCFAMDGFTGEQGTAPSLWDYTYDDEQLDPLHSTAFAGNSLSSLSNYGDIPNDWIV